MRRAITLYKNYGIYTNTEKMLPSIVDGLLPVHRRVLYVLHNIASSSKSKTATVLGELMGKYHPHATSVGPAFWAVRNDFAIGEGSWGSNIGIEPIGPADPRYTSMQAHPFIEKNIMKYVDYSKFEINEVGFDEPVHLPTPFPLCLISQEELSMIGFGVKTEFPLYNKKDLLKRLLFLLKKVEKDVLIKPLIPGCDVLSTNKELKNLLLTGEAKIKVRGKYTEDPKNGIVYIHGWAPGRRFDGKKKDGGSGNGTGGLYNKILKYISSDKEFGYLVESGGIGFIDESTSTTGTKIRFEILKQRNVNKFYDVMKNAIDKALTSTVRYSMYVTNDKDKDNIFFKLSSVDEMILECYNNYKNVYENYCKVNIQKYKERIDELKIISQIKPHISNIEIKKDIDKAIEQISKLSSVPPEMIKPVLEKYTIKKLLTYNSDTVELKEKQKDLELKLKNLETTVIKNIAETIES